MIVGSLGSPALFAVVIPSQVLWSYLSGGVVLAVGLATIFLRGRWQSTQGIDKLLLFGPVFYAAPLAAFGTEHFTLTAGVASLVPKWIPFHVFWVLFLGACFIVAALAMVTGILARFAATMVGVNFFLFVVLMDAPGWARRPGSWILAVLTLRELAFSGGALALASVLSDPASRSKVYLATVARYFIAAAVLLYCVEQFLHGTHVPGVPLEKLTPDYVPGHAIWSYLAGAIYR